jgi:hypothetical protein
VPESSNIEIVHRLTEHRDAESAKKSWQDLVVEILEAVLLGVVAVATAWSAYHAAKWDGREAELYAQASTLRIEANELDTLGGQQRLLDVSTFNTWIQARNEFRVAFDAWLKTNPFSNPTAPPGPSFMPEYRNPQILQGAAANREASRIFDEGTAARKHSEECTAGTGDQKSLHRWLIGCKDPDCKPQRNSSPLDSWSPASYFGQWRTGATQWAHTRGMRSRGTGTTRALPGSPFNQPPAVAIVASYAMSDRVSHDRYGLGTVVGTENGNAAVLVDFGPKVLRVPLPTTKMVKL